MAGHLLTRAGQNVRVWNRTATKASAWLQKFPSGSVASSPKDAARDADFVMLCVGNDDDLRSVVLGSDGVLEGMKTGSVIVDHTTASAHVARELYSKAKEKGVGFIDAPVSGGEAGAVNGVLTVMCGGDAEVYEKAEKVILGSYARMCKLIGGPGAGQQCKMVNQVCISGILQGLSEGLVLAKAAGLDTDTVIDVISKGAAQSWQMENRHKTMVNGEFDFGFKVEWMRKDLGIVLEGELRSCERSEQSAPTRVCSFLHPSIRPSILTFRFLFLPLSFSSLLFSYTESKKLGLSMPVTALVDQFYADVEAMGGSKWDTSSLIARLEAFKNLKKE